MQQLENIVQFIFNSLQNLQEQIEFKHALMIEIKPESWKTWSDEPEKENEIHYFKNKTIS